ncbi:hypothetical protein FSW04_01155 [Baekduia soli]|uniref:YitT family protein n=1 Tax=Baekduia soli TaxID=496014 RepID=A0A5B8U013_9ACTN|nr:hypothetical protein [Baekduia soli]QEC46320.1 hypothetical protein FSW04_01155 [Baekduia soli]
MRADAAPPRALRRLTQLHAGLVLFGLGASAQLLAGLGNSPWDVLHQGLARTFGLTVGAWVFIVGALVLLAWIPLRERPGIGTISNVVVISIVVEIMLSAFGPAHGIVVRIALLVGGVLASGVAVGLYLGADLGPGPRDGLMTAFVKRGHSMRVVRTTIEVTVLLAGTLLGGTVGVGTLLFALAIGPLAHLTVPFFAVAPAPEPAPAPA